MSIEQVKVTIKDGKGSIQYIVGGVPGKPSGGLEISEAKAIAKRTAKYFGTIYGVTNQDLIEQSRLARAKMSGGTSDGGGSDIG